MLSLLQLLPAKLSRMGSLNGVWLLKAAMLLCLQAAVLFTDAKNDLSKDEYLAMKQRLKTLNKPAIQSIEMDNGDIFDCVDIYKQPAFDHPLLKNHTIQMKPSSFPLGFGNQTLSNSVLDVGLPGDGCPVGTVPIKRITMEDLLSAPSPLHFGKKYVLNDSQTIFQNSGHPHHHWADVKTKNGEFHGTKVTINLWQPDVGYSDKFSLAQFWITGGADDKLNTVEAGWHVYPKLHDNNNHPRLFAYWTADGYHNTGCYNTLCPGFVQTTQKMPLGVELNPVSTYNGEQYEITVGSFLDPHVNLWWLVVGDEVIGYWPAKIFSSITSKADGVHWGGEVYNPNEGINQLKSESPPMGSGHFAEEGFRKASYMRVVKVVNTEYTTVDAPKDILSTPDRPKCYSVDDQGFVNDIWRKAFFFGGPGGNCI